MFATVSDGEHGVRGGCRQTQHRADRRQGPQQRRPETPVRAGAVPGAAHALPAGQDQDGGQPLGSPQDRVPRRHHRPAGPLGRPLRRLLQDGSRVTYISATVKL